MNEENWADAEERMNTWRMRAQRNRMLHYAASQSLFRFHYLFGVPTIAVGAVVASLGAVSAAGSTQIWISVTVASLGAVAAVLSAVQTFLKYGSRAEAHRQAGVRFGTVARKIETVLAMPPRERESIRDVLERLEGAMTNAAAEAPTLSEKYITRTLKKYDRRSSPNPWDSDDPHSEAAMA